MNKKEFIAFIKKFKPLKTEIKLDEFVKLIKKIYILDFKNVYFILKNKTYQKTDKYFLELLIFSGYNDIINKVEKVKGDSYDRDQRKNII